jgi:hypothetical protein
MPSRIPHGAAEPVDPAPTVRAWFDALMRGDLGTLKHMTHPEFQFRGEGPAAFAPATGRKALLERAREVKRGQIGCPTLMGVERLPGGGFVVTWEMAGEDGKAKERGLSFAHADSRVVRSVATHAVAIEDQWQLKPLPPNSPIAGDPHQRVPEGWETLRERVRLSGSGWLNEGSRTPLQSIPWQGVRRWGWRLCGVLAGVQILMFLVRRIFE